MRCRSALFLLCATTTGVAGITVFSHPSAAFAQGQAMIEHVEPTAGPPGTRVNIVGRGFRQTVKVMFNDHELTLTHRDPERLEFEIPAGATSGRFVVVHGHDEVESEVFRITAAEPVPTVSSIQPTAAAPGTEVVIRGEHFAPRLVDNQIRIGATAMVVRSGDTTSLRVVVPDGVVTGPITIKTPGGEVQTASLTINTRVTVREFTPVAAAPGSHVTLTGTGFSATVTNNTVTINNRRLRVIRATADTLEVEIPVDQQEGGRLLVVVDGAGRFETGAALRVAPAPVLLSADPPQGAPHTRVTLRGLRFGSSPANVQAWLGDTPAVVLNAAPDALAVEVPAGAPTGRWRITVGGIGPIVAPTTFSVLASLSIDGVTPTLGDIGDTITLHGTGFSAIPSHNVVKLGALVAPVVSATSTSLVVRVPPSARSGQWSVTVTGNPTEFRVRDPFVVALRPHVERFEPARAVPGGHVVLHGQNFPNDRSLVQVRLGENDCEVVSTTRDTIEVTLPQAAQPGPARLSVNVRLQGTGAAASDLLVLVPSQITSIEPVAAPVGATVVTHGTGFETDLHRLRFRLGSVPIVPRRVTTTEIEFVVPPRAQSGEITVGAEQREEAHRAFIVTVPPVLQSATPTQGRSGSRVTLRGRSFGSSVAAVSVTLGSASCNVISVTPTAIVVELPAGSVTGTFTVTLKDQGASVSSTAFRVTD